MASHFSLYLQKNTCTISDKADISLGWKQQPRHHYCRSSVMFKKGIPKIFQKAEHGGRNLEWSQNRSKTQLKGQFSKQCMQKHGAAWQPVLTWSFSDLSVYTVLGENNRVPFPWKKFLLTTFCFTALILHTEVGMPIASRNWATDVTIFN